MVDLCLRLVRKGYLTSVVTQHGPDQTLLKVLERGGVDVHADLWRPSHLPEERARLLAEWVRKRDVDVYVISASPDVGWLALPLLDPDVATISVAHNDNNAFYEPLWHYHPFVDTAVAVSEEIQRKLVAGGTPSERVRQIPYGVEPLSEAEIEDRCNRPRDSLQPLNIAYMWGGSFRNKNEFWSSCRSLRT